MNCSMERGIYIHIPFCLSKCPYCNFLSIPKGVIPDGYITAILKELEGRREEGIRGIGTVYLGGGTPSLLPPEEVERILKSISRLYPFEGREVTIEVNPGTVTLKDLEGYVNAGVNRISIGIQSFNDKLLSILGRTHTSKDGLMAFVWARKAGFKNIGIDIIHSIPTEGLSNLRKDIQTAISLRPEHISLYALTFEDGTPLKRKVEEGHLRPVGEEKEVEMFLLARDMLIDAGYEHYEVSNFSLPGLRSIHNQIYWKGGEYIGLGLGAHSYEKKGWGVRRKNTEILEEYIALIEKEGKAFVEEEELTKEEAMVEAIFLGLRTMEGIDLKDFEDRFGVSLERACREAIEELLSEGLLRVEGGSLRATGKGLLLLDEIVRKLL